CERPSSASVRTWRLQPGRLAQGPEEKCGITGRTPGIAELMWSILPDGRPSLGRGVPPSRIRKDGDSVKYGVVCRCSGDDRRTGARLASEPHRDAGPHGVEGGAEVPHVVEAQVLVFGPQHDIRQHCPIDAGAKRPAVADRARW